MRRISPSLSACIAAVLLAAGATSAIAADLRELKLIEAEGNTRAVLELSSRTEYKLFTLDNPRRLVLDLSDSRSASGLRLPAPNGVVAGVRTGQPSPGVLRVVFDLGSAAQPRSRIEQLGGQTRLIVEMVSPSGRRGDAPTVASVVATAAAPVSILPPPVELMPVPQASSVAPLAAAAVPATTQTNPQSATQVASHANAAKTLQDMFGNSQRKLVVAVDAGHGGKDPGAHGPTNVHEKDVTLATARELARQINAEPGMKAVLIRDGDVFVPLQDRYMRARQAQADLFVSIHADASPSRTATGASVFVLSTRGASSQAARWLADQENAADLVGGVSLDDKDRNLSAVLLDLSQSATMRASDDVAGQVLAALKNVGRAHKGEVERANFVVLRSPDVPSMLVETGFITNPTEEQKLNDPVYRSRLASAIVDGVRQFFTSQPPPGTWYAALAESGQAPPSEHVVVQGETLSLIAARHGVPMDSLLAANNKHDGNVRVGEHLLIPASAPR